MSKIQTIKTSFVGGEVSPYALGRVDVDKYHSWCESVQNYIPLIQGGAQRRPGLRYVAQAMGPSRLIPFKFNLTTAYVLEFGDQTLRFYKNGAQIGALGATPQPAWSAVIGGNTLDGPLTWTCLGFPDYGDRGPEAVLNQVIIGSSGNLFVCTGGGGTFIGTIFNQIPGTTTVEAFGAVWFNIGVPQWQPLTIYADASVVYTSEGVQQVTAGGGNESSGGTVTMPYQVSTPYDTSVDSLWDLKFAQFADIMYLTHPNHPMQKLNRLGDSSWVLLQPALRPPPSHAFDQDISGNLSAGTQTVGLQELGGPVLNVVDTSDFNTSGTLNFITSITLSPPFGGTVNFPQQVVYKNTTPTSFIGCSGGSGPCAPGTQITGPGTGGGGGATLTPAATTGMGVAFTSSVSGIFLAGDVGKQVVAGAGVAYVTAVSGTFVIADILDGFASTNPIPAGSWFLRGSPQAWGAFGAIGTNSDSASCYVANPLLGPGSVVNFFTFKKFPVPQAHTDNPVQPPAQVDSFRDQDVGSYLVVGGSVGEILSITSASEVSVRLLSEIEATTVTADGTTNSLPIAPGAWSLEESSFSDANGYPIAVCFFQDRLCLAGTLAQPQNIWCSVTGDYENFAKGSNDDDGIDEEVNSGFREQIQWLAAYQAQICAGTLESEYMLSGGAVSVGGNSGPGITPSNFTALMQSRYGVAPIQPLFVENYLLYIQRSKLTGYEMSYDIWHGVYGSKNLNLFSDIITTSGFKEMAYAQIPYRVLWFTDLTGNLVGLTYNKENDIWGWHRHFTGQDLTTPDQFISVTTIPDPFALADQTWVCTGRQINGATSYFIEVMDPTLYCDAATSVNNSASIVSLELGLGTGTTFNYSFEITPPVDKGSLQITYVVGGKSYLALDLGNGVVRERNNFHSGHPLPQALRNGTIDYTTGLITLIYLLAPDLNTPINANYTGSQITEVTGLGYLQGRSVVINADNAVLGPYVVPANGTINFQQQMPSGAASVQVGLPYTAVLKTVRPEFAQGFQSTQGLNKRWSRIWVRVYNTLGITINQDGGNEQTPSLRTQTDLIGTGVPPFTGDLDVTSLQWDRDGRLLIQQFLPLPSTILAAFGTVEWGDN